MAVTAAVVLALAGAAVFAPAPTSSHAPASAALPPSQDAAPLLDVAPTPLGLPPRSTSAPPPATVPFRAVGTLTPGDCLQTYPSKTADAYPVIDCGLPHIAQLLSKGELPQPRGAAFPGKDALDAQVGDLCEQHLDWEWVAVWNEDVQVDLRYADTISAWASGDRSYYCFVYTYSRHELTGSAVAG